MKRSQECCCFPQIKKNKTAHVQKVNRKNIDDCVKSSKRRLMHRKFPDSLIISWDVKQRIRPNASIFLASRCKSQSLGINPRCKTSGLHLQYLGGPTCFTKTLHHPTELIQPYNGWPKTFVIMAH